VKSSPKLFSFIVNTLLDIKDLFDLNYYPKDNMGQILLELTYWIKAADNSIFLVLGKPKDKIFYKGRKKISIANKISFV
jgi:hypothetical protein